MEPATKPRLNDAFIRYETAIVLILLIIQFVVGMYLNLYVEIPKVHPGNSASYAPSIPWAIAGGAGLALAIHVIGWIALTLGGIALLVHGIVSRRKALIIGNSLGFFFVLTAGSGGLGFLNRGDDAESFTMAIGFILALLAYGFAFSKARRKRRGDDDNS